MSRRIRGFTIVELLVVIVVIAILATVTIVAYSNIQNRATATSINNDFLSIDKAFRLYATEQGLDTWPLETTFATSNPSITSIISSTTLKQYIQSVNPPSGSPAPYYFYDNDTDSSTISGCVNPTLGPNVILANFSNQAIASVVDSIADDGDLNCGKIRYTPGMLIYKLGSTQTIESK